MSRTAAVATLVLILIAPLRPKVSASAGGYSTFQQQQYVCPMHPDVVSKSPGTCPKCGMKLRVKTPTARGQAAGDEPGEHTQDDGRPLNIPDTTVLDQDGARLHFFTDLVKGKTVAINFIFTTCTTICPPLTATFRKVQQELHDRAGREVELISISVDPATDVPERMKAFAAKFNAGPGWAFVTGTKPDIDQLLKALGAYVGDKNGHSPMILIGNESSGYWTRTYGLAPASAILKVVDEAARNGAKSPSQAAALYFP